MISFDFLLDTWGQTLWPADGLTFSPCRGPNVWPFPGQTFCPWVERTVCPRLASLAPVVCGQVPAAAVWPEALHAEVQVDTPVWDPAWRVLAGQSRLDGLGLGIAESLRLMGLRGRWRSRLHDRFDSEDRTGSGLGFRCRANPCEERSDVVRADPVSLAGRIPSRPLPRIDALRNAPAPRPRLLQFDLRVEDRIDQSPKVAPGDQIRLGEASAFARSWRVVSRPFRRTMAAR